MEWEKAVAIALVVGFIGPAFWLGVQMLERRFWLWIRGRREAKQAAAANNGLFKKLP